MYKIDRRGGVQKSFSRTDPTTHVIDVLDVLDVIDVLDILDVLDALDILDVLDVLDVSMYFLNLIFSINQ